MLENARDRSATVQLLTVLGIRLEAAVRRSRITALGRLGRGYVMASFCYRWLTTEPDPEVIVIDLRETKTVGPIIAVLDRLLAGLDRLLAGLTRATATSAIAAGASTVAAHGRDRPVAVASLVVLPAVVASLFGLAAGGALTTPVAVGHLLIAAMAALGLRSDRSLDDLRETTAARVLASAFEPPAPPDSATQHPPDYADSGDADHLNADSDDRPNSSNDTRPHGATGRDLEESAAGNAAPSAADGSTASDTPDEGAGRN